MSGKKRTSSDMSPTVSFLLALLASLAAAVAPLIVRLAQVPYQAEQIEFRRPYGGDDIFYDLFAYNKGIFIIVLGACALAVLLFTQSFRGFLQAPPYAKGEKKESPFVNGLHLVTGHIYFFCAAGAALLVLLSAAFSKYPYTAFNGMVERYEGAFVILAYLILFYTASRCIQSGLQLNMILYSVVGSSVLIGLVGLTQYVRNDMYSWVWFQKLMGNPDPLQSPFQISAVTVYGTFFNPNYMGVYTSMLVPLLLVLVLFAPVKSVIKYASAAACVLMILCLIGSTSRSAYIALPISLLVCVGVYAVAMIKAREGKKLLRGFVILLLALVVGVSAVLVGIGETKREQLIARTTSIFQQSEEVFMSPILDLQYNDQKELVVTMKKGVFSIGVTTAMQTITYTIRDAGGTLLAPVSESPAENGIAKAVFELPDIGKVTIEKYLDQNYISVAAGTSPIYVVLHATHGAVLLDAWGRGLTSLAEAPYFMPFGNESMLSARGYIWSRSIPLMKNTLFLGYGADCFVYEFPQTDVVNILQNFGRMASIVDKPHQFYLQWGINNGVLSLLLILIIFFVYAVQAIRLLVRAGSFQDQWQIASLAILAAVIGFLVSSFANDSSTSVSSVFWVLLGTGVGVNLKMKKELEKKNLA